MFSTASIATLVGGSSTSKLAEQTTKTDSPLDGASTSKEENSSASELRKKLAACEERFQVNGEVPHLMIIWNLFLSLAKTSERSAFFAF